MGQHRPPDPFAQFRDESCVFGPGQKLSGQEQSEFGGWELIYEGSLNSVANEVYSVGNWCYRVRAFDHFSYGSWSNTVCTLADSVNYLIFMPAVLKE